MQHLEVSGAVRHIYIYIYVIRRLRVNNTKALTHSPGTLPLTRVYSDIKRNPPFILVGPDCSLMCSSSRLLLAVHRLLVQWL